MSWLVARRQGNDPARVLDQTGINASNVLRGKALDLAGPRESDVNDFFITDALCSDPRRLVEYRGGRPHGTVRIGKAQKLLIGRLGCQNGSFKQHAERLSRASAAAAELHQRGGRHEGSAVGDPP